jgi:orotate phosphoribosyltransferase
VPTPVTLPLRVHAGDPDRVAALLSTTDAIRTGHFQLLSGRHTDTFFAFSAIARDPHAVHQIAGWIAPAVAPWDADLILAPSTAGVALATSLAAHLCLPLALSSLGTEGRAHGVLGDVDLADRRVLLVNDVLTTGQGLDALARTVRDVGGHVAGATWFLTRTPELPELLPASHQAVATVPLPSWTAADCRLCDQSQPTELAQDLN